MEFARFGKFVVMQNTMTADQHQIYLRLLAERLPEVIAEIDAHVAAIIRVVQEHHPLALLHRAYWEQVGPMILNDGERSETKESVVAQRMVDYVQSVIAAVPPKKEPHAELAQSPHPQRRKAASLLLDWDGHTKEQMATGIQSTMKEQAQVGRPKPYSIHGDDIGFTIYCWQQGVLEAGLHDAVGHAKACLLLAQKDEWMLLQLFFSGDGKLEEVRPTIFTARDISQTERAKFAPRVEQMRENRLKAAASTGNLGRNDLCPCGSGRKYKKCCQP